MTCLGKCSAQAACREEEESRTLKPPAPYSCSRADIVVLLFPKTEPSLLRAEHPAGPSSAHFEMCPALLFPCWVSSALLWKERPQGKKQYPCAKPSVAWRRPGLRRNQQERSGLGKVALPSTGPQAKTVPPRCVRTIYVPRRACLQIFPHFFMTSNTRLIQSRNTLAYVRQEFASQVGPHQKAQKNLCYTQHYFISFFC